MLFKIIDTFKMIFLTKKFEYFSDNVRNNKIKPKFAIILAPYMPPYTSGGVFRPMSWAKYASENKWEAAFVTKKYRNDDISEVSSHLLKQIPNYIKIYNVSGDFIQPAWKLTPKVDGHFVSALEAVKVGLSLMQEVRPSVIVATGPSFDFFIAGYLLSKASGLPLVIDYRDEWTANPFTFVNSGNKDSLWERKIFQHAKKIIFTTRSMLEYQSILFKRSDNLEVVYNGWEESEVYHEESGLCPRPSSDVVNLLYAGWLGEHANPSAFFNDLMKCSKELVLKVKITILGEISSECLEVIDKYSEAIKILVIKPVTRLEAIRIMRNHDYLLLFSDKCMSRYIPGKLFDYAASGVPILGHGVSGEISRSIEGGKLGFFCNVNDISKLEETLNGMFLDKFEQDKIHREGWLLDKSRKVQAGRFFDILTEVSD